MYVLGVERFPVLVRLLTLVFLVFVNPAIAAAAPKRVLLLQSFGQDFPLWSEYSKHLRSEIFRQLPQAVDLFEAAARILAGETPANVQTPPVGFAPPKFDWRELQRWGIDESNLPAGSPSSFASRASGSQHRWSVLGTFAIVLFQAAIIAALLFERLRRRSAEDGVAPPASGIDADEPVDDRQRDVELDRA